MSIEALIATIGGIASLLVIIGGFASSWGRKKALAENNEKDHDKLEDNVNKVLFTVGELNGKVDIVLHTLEIELPKFEKRLDEMEKLVEGHIKVTNGHN